MGKGSNYIFLIKICESFAYTLHNLIYVVHLSVNSVTDSFLFLEGSTTLKGPTLRQIYRRKYNKLKENVKKNGLGHFFFFLLHYRSKRTLSFLRLYASLKLSYKI